MEEETTRAYFKKLFTDESHKYYGEPHSGKKNKKRDFIYIFMYQRRSSDGITQACPSPLAKEQKNICTFLQF
jgi:hypothetical protein